MVRYERVIILRHSCGSPFVIPVVGAGIKTPRHSGSLLAGI